MAPIKKLWKDAWKNDAAHFSDPSPFNLIKKDLKGAMENLNLELLKTLKVKDEKDFKLHQPGEILSLKSSPTQGQQPVQDLGQALVPNWWKGATEWEGLWEGLSFGGASKQTPPVMVSVRCVGRPILDHLDPSLTAKFAPCFVEAVRVPNMKVEEWEHLKQDAVSSLVLDEWLPPTLEKYVTVLFPNPSVAAEAIPVFGTDEYWYWTTHQQRHQQLRLRFVRTARRDPDGLVIYQLTHDYLDY